MKWATALFLVLAILWVFISFGVSSIFTTETAFQQMIAQNTLRNGLLFGIFLLLIALICKN